MQLDNVLENLLDNQDFGLLMKMHIYECIDFLLQNGINFSVMSNLPLVKFEPELPPEITSNFTMPVILFTLAGYTFESVKLSQESLSFEAGFGANNYGSVVSMPLGAIVQILIEDSPILVNFAIHKSKPTQKSEAQKSMSVFMSNPKNRELFNKK
ncbi:hypothetical protein KDE12_04500 [Campylobacter sp. faydin G-105]|uniref:hypothetical protein n=1 Tax=Campylobacter anatolicus TaxID=2829105 RepID=UPI001B8FED3F|nr:hypothetical protein [Campylobacter anatolicus]MBR8462115.1 hypothetical protein [Campylobacter anatolicus]